MKIHRVLISSAIAVALLGSVLLTNSPAHAAGFPANPAAQGSTNPEPGSTRTITVSGIGTVNLTPDIARINIGVNSENKEIAAAVNANSTAVKKLKDVLIKAGVDEKDIQTTNFSVYQNQKYDTSGQPTEKTYSVDNSLSVIVRDLEKLSEVLQSAVASGANNIYGIQFDVADSSKAMAEARDLALAKAEKQAGETAQVMKVKLGLVHSVTINNDNYFMPMYGGLGGGGAQAAAPNIPISAGQLTITVNAVVSYQIVD